jgi:hypothetical protein
MDERWNDGTRVDRAVFRSVVIASVQIEKLA